MVNLARHWISSGGNEQLWGKKGTYRVVPYDALPTVQSAEAPLNGSFDWLTSGPKPMYGMTFEHQEEEGLNIPDLVDDRVAEARRLGFTIPSLFVRFAKEANLHGRISSVTACYWDLGARLVPIPGQKGPSRLLRFMNDQQACYLWYLLLEPKVADVAIVVARPEWREDAAGDALEDHADPADLAICAPDFEQFIRRLWIEERLWNATHGRVVLDPIADSALIAYREAAQQAAALFSTD